MQEDLSVPASGKRRDQNVPSYLLDPPYGHAFGVLRPLVGELEALDIESWLSDNGYPYHPITMFPAGDGSRILIERAAIADTERL